MKKALFAKRTQMGRAIPSSLVALHCAPFLSSGFPSSHPAGAKTRRAGTLVLPLGFRSDGDWDAPQKEGNSLISATPPARSHPTAVATPARHPSFLENDDAHSMVRVFPGQPGLALLLDRTPTGEIL